MPGWFEFVVLALASWRAWRLLAEDSILDRPRAWALRRVEEGSPLDEWWFCPWCSGAWVAALVYASYLWPGPGTWDGVWTAVAVVLALSASVGLLESAHERTS